METSDAFIRSNVVFRNSTIWYPQTVGIPAGGLTHTAAQWTQLNTSGDVVQGGRVEDPTATATNGGFWYSYPSIAVNATDDVLFRHTDEPERFTVIHLSWLGRTEINSKHPTVEFDGTFAEFLAEEKRLYGLTTPEDV